jgi:hypothetical protein
MGGLFDEEPEEEKPKKKPKAKPEVDPEAAPEAAPESAPEGAPTEDTVKEDKKNNPTKRVGLLYQRLSALIEALRKAAMTDEDYISLLNDSFTFKELLAHTIDNLTSFDEEELEKIVEESEDEFRTLLYKIKDNLKREQ